jgi:hypothetical protein
MYRIINGKARDVFAKVKMFSWTNTQLALLSEEKPEKKVKLEKKISTKDRPDH